ncbi:MAG: mechanosensitive ion channel family protein [Symploca sp. SIO1B1]|nr:mechanosensitive ion channel family protein [Symploca sp. SIO1B1]
MDIVIIIAEVCILISVTILLNWVLGILVNKLTTLGKFTEYTQPFIRQHKTIQKIVTLSGVLLCLVTIGVNGFIIYQGRSVQEFQLNLLQLIPPQFWSNLAISTLKSVMIVLLVKLSLPRVNIFIDQLSIRAQNYDDVDANDESVAEFFEYLKNNLNIIIWITAGILLIQFFPIPDIIQNYLYIPLKIYLAITMGFLVIKAISIGIDTLDHFSTQYSDARHPLRLYERFRDLILLLQKFLQYIIYVSIATLVFEEIEFISWLTTYTNIITEVIVVIFISQALIQGSYFFLEELVLKPKNLTEEQKKRRHTLIPLAKSLLKYLVYFCAAISILKLLSIDPGPILAGAGILGLALGLGAQALINDIVCGFFILFENYYLVGDYIEAGREEERTVEGIVEAIELRTTRIRHPSGQLQIISNGEIGSIVNYSKDYIYATVEISVSYQCNLEHLCKIIQQVGEQINASESDVLEPTKVEGLENFGKEKLLLLTLTKVKPGKHLHVQRVLRKLLKLSFDQEGIELSNF